MRNKQKILESEVRIGRLGNEDPEQAVRILKKAASENILYVIDDEKRQRTYVIMRADKHNLLSEQTIGVLRDLCHGIGIVCESECESIDFESTCSTTDRIRHDPEGTTMKAYKDAVDAGFEVTFFVK